MNGKVSELGKVKVSIWCATYNHRNYIRNALDGFLKQNTDFRYEIFVYDDASDDGTSEIIKNYVETYPGCFRYYRAEINKYGTQERVEIIEKLQRKYLTGEYIAMCEGDDYWVDSDKIQQQVEYLESHPDCVLTAHNAEIVTAGEIGTIDLQFRNVTGNIPAREIILSSNGDIPSASLLMRREIFFMDGCPKCPVGDISRLLFAITKGDVYYENKKKSIYRYMINGSWSNRMKEDPEFALMNIIGYIVFLRNYDKFVNYNYRKYIFKALSSITINAGLEGFKEDEKYSLVMLVDKVADELKADSIEGLLNRIKMIINIFHYGLDYENIIKNYVSKYSKLYLFGNGKYAKYMKTVCQNLNVNIDGILISGSDGDCEAIGIESYKGDFKTIGLIVALHPKWEEEVKPILKEYKINDYLAPFWLTEEIIFGNNLWSKEC